MYDPLGYSALSAGRSFWPSLRPAAYALAGTFLTNPALSDPNLQYPTCCTSRRKDATEVNFFGSRQELSVAGAVGVGGTKGVLGDLAPLEIFGVEYALVEDLLARFSCKAGCVVKIGVPRFECGDDVGCSGHREGSPL